MPVWIISLYTLYIYIYNIYLTNVTLNSWEGYDDQTKKLKISNLVHIIMIYRYKFNDKIAFWKIYILGNMQKTFLM